MTTQERYTIVARALSWALHPLIVPLYLLLVLFSQTAFIHFSSLAKWYLCGITALYGIVIPILAIGLLRWVGRIKNFKLTKRHERIAPLLVGATCYLIAAITISRIEAADFLRKALVAAALSEALAAWITLRWKISLHLVAAGIAVALFTVLNLLGLPQMLLPLVIAIVASGLLATARLYLQKHDLRQIGCGFGLGFAVTMTALFFL